MSHNWLQTAIHTVLVAALAYFMVAIMPTGWLTPIGVWIGLILLAVNHRRPK